MFIFILSIYRRAKNSWVIFINMNFQIFCFQKRCKIFREPSFKEMCFFCSSSLLKRMLSCIFLGEGRRFYCYVVFLVQQKYEFFWLFSFSFSLRHTIPTSAVYLGYWRWWWTHSSWSLHWNGWTLLQGWRRIWMERNC